MATQPDPPVPTAALLRASRLFDGMAEATLQELAQKLSCEMAAPGQLLISEGEVAAHMFVVLSGEVEVSHQGSRDHDVRVALLGPGDWVGEMALLEAQPSFRSVRALASSALLRLTAADVHRCSTSAPSISTRY